MLDVRRSDIKNFIVLYARASLIYVFAFLKKKKKRKSSWMTPSDDDERETAVAGTSTMKRRFKSLSLKTKKNEILSMLQC